jgi:glycosyltransferase involved in cell wall biosynthesis
MKIAIVASPYVPVPPPKYGGLEKVIHYLVKGLKEEGHEPILLAPGDSTEDCEIIPIVEKSLSFPKDKSKLADFDKKVLQINRDTKRIVKELLPSIDVIHSHSYRFDMREFATFPHVITLHGPIVLDKDKNNNIPINFYMGREHLNYISISKNQQDTYPNLNYLDVVYNGEDPKEFPVIMQPQNYVCFVGRFDREKNPHMAIQLATNYGIKIKLAGKIDVSGNDYFEEEIKPYFKNPLVEYMGELNAKETTKLLSRAKINLHPTGFREPFGLSVLEAAYCGTPTLAISRGSMPELIQNGHTGKLVEDFVEGFHHVDECFNMNRDYIAKRSRHKFNYKNMAKGYIKAYKKAIKNSK